MVDTPILLPEIEVSNKPDTISVDPTATGASQTVSVDPGSSNNVPLDPSIVANRAYKAHQGLEQFGTSYDQIHSAISNGQEDQLRAQSAADVDVSNQKAKAELLAKFAGRLRKPLTPELTKYILDNFEELSQATDPDTVLETQYGKAHTANLNTAAQNVPESEYSEAKREIPLQVNEIEKRVSSAVAKRDYLVSQEENVAAIVKNQPWGSYLGDLALGLVPGYTETKLRSNVEGTTFLEGGLLGNNLEQQRQRLISLPLPQMKIEYQRFMNTLKESNPGVALQFAKAMVGQTTDESFLNNIMTGIEVATDASIVKGVSNLARSKRLLDSAKRTGVDFAKAASEPDLSKPAITEAAGDVKSASLQGATQNAVETMAGTTDTTKRALDALPTALRADKAGLRNNTGSFREAEIAKIEADYDSTEKNILRAVEDRLRVDRTPAALSEEEILKQIQADLKNRYPGLRNNIAEVSAPIHDKISNTYSFDLKIMDNDGHMFGSDYDAERFAIHQGLTDFKFGHKGLGTYLTINKPWAETDVITRDLLLTAKNAQDPHSFIDEFMKSMGKETKETYLANKVAKLRTPEETLSLAHRSNRHAVTYGQSYIQKLLESEGSAIRDVYYGMITKDPVTGMPVNRFGYKYMGRAKTNKRFEEFERTLRYSREMVDDLTGLPGKFFDTPGALEDFYQMTFHRPPDDVELRGYFAFKKMVEVDRIFRNINLFRNKTRNAVENHNVYWYEDGKRVVSDSFDGALKKTFPRAKEDKILIINAEGKHEVKDLDGLGTKRVKELEKQVKEGQARLVEAWEPADRPFENIPGAGNNRIRYIMSENLDTKPLSWEQVPRRGGGHFEYDYDNYIKQAKIRPDYNATKKEFRHWYEGDTTVMPIAIRKMGNEVVGHLENVRLALKAGDADAARLAARPLPIKWEEINSWFNPSRDIKGNLQPARLSLDEPFRVVPKNKNIIDIDNTMEARFRSKDGTSTTLRDGTKQHSMARKNQVEFTGARDTNDIHTISPGTRENPLYVWETAKLIDPLPSMSRALSRIVRSTFLDDYKMFAVEHWLQDASRFLQPSISEIRSSPYWHFLNPSWRSGASNDQIARLKAANFHIQQLLGVRSELDSALHNMAQKLADSIYSKFGPNSRLLVAAEALPHLRDPIGFIRSVVYHKTLGMFNPAQLLKQMNTFASIFGIAGSSRATPGSIAALATTWTRFNKHPEIMNKLDDMLASFRVPGAQGWKQGWFKESSELLDRTGFSNVQGEYAPLDREISVNIVQSAGRSLLDAGTTLFKGGEKMVRYGAFHTAYMEFREANPLVKIGDKEIRSLLTRADLLYGNMSKASSSFIHEGAASLVTQFFTYQLRATELFVGKRLTELERGRLFWTYAAIYGVPSATGLTALPFADLLRKDALKDGYVVGDGMVNSVIREGLLSTATAAISAGPSNNFNPKLGTWYNFGQSWGLQGISTNALISDKPLWQVVMGASGSALGDLFADSWDFGSMIINGFFRDSNDPKYFRPKNEDALQFLKEINSVSKGAQWIAALNTGKWLTKKDGILEDKVSAYDATYRFIAGLQSQDAADQQTVKSINNDRQALARWGMNRFTQEMHRGYMAQANNPEQAHEYFGRANAILNIAGIPPEQWGHLISRANEGYEDIISKSKFDMYRKAPLEDKEKMLKSFQHFNDIKDLKGK